MNETPIRIPQQPERILLIRLGAIGDIVMASGLVPALRSLWPHAHLTWLAEEGPHQLLASNPRLDCVHPLPRRKWKRLVREGHPWQVFGEMMAQSRQLRKESFDLVLDLQGLLKSGIWAFASGARTRIGLGSREGSQWLMTDCFPREMRDPRMGKEYRALGIALGADPKAFKADIAIPPTAMESAKSLLGLQTDRRGIACFAPFTTRPQKHWFDDRWIDLAKSLTPKYRCILLGGPEERARSETMVEASQGALETLTGQTSLIECAGLIKTADLVVGVDTGLTHLAMATEKPTIALFGSTRPYWEADHACAEILYVPEPCSPCHRHPSCGGRFTCMQHHTVDSVMEAIARISKTC